MANVRSEWSREHRRAVEALEERLGREVCGVPTGEGEPCSQWPVSARHGRCRAHADSVRTEGSGFALFGTSKPESTGEAPESSESSPPAPVDRSVSFWVALALTGIVLGGGIVGGLVYYDAIWIPRSVAMTRAGFSASPADTNARVVAGDFDPANPDFRRIRSLYRQGEVDRVAVALESVIRRGRSRSDRARAMYLQFVLYQNQEAYQQALDVADRFLETFQEHDRRPEVLFGAAFLCQRFLERPRKAEQYFRRLQERYPESSWAHRRSALS